MQTHLYNEFSTLEGSHWWFVARRKYLHKIISMFYDQKFDLHFCEIGCGTGGNLNMLSEFATTDAVEVNDAARQCIKEQEIIPSKNIYPGSLPDQIPLKGVYDGVFSLDVIEHVKDDIAALRSLKRLVNENGFLITTVPAYQWLWSEHDVANHHYRRYSKTDYCNRLKMAGFDICYASYFNSLLFPLLAPIRAVSDLGTTAKPITNATISKPIRIINNLLNSIFGLESLWAGKISIPFGLSIIVVAKPSATNAPPPFR